MKKMRVISIKCVLNIFLVFIFKLKARNIFQYGFLFSSNIHLEYDPVK